ncbi:hypothetical protein CHS0354_003852 [Potamilus streckersoni]|uniref:Uncharacterized protein n=1 Tax=Potamilus streckersoni TaxID=2493646 RepID=A0AAE0SGC9_9BIVA|nr:hypothetical protein CHS0354_003852 [Potamilus streckersoni]
MSMGKKSRGICPDTNTDLPLKIDYLSVHLSLCFPCLDHVGTVFKCEQPNSHPIKFSDPKLSNIYSMPRNRQGYPIGTLVSAHGTGSAPAIFSSRDWHANLSSHLEFVVSFHNLKILISFRLINFFPFLLIICIIFVQEDDEESRRLTRTNEAFSHIIIPLQCLPPASRSSLLSLKKCLPQTNTADENSMQEQTFDTLTLEEYYQSVKAQAVRVHSNSAWNLHGLWSESNVTMDTK